MNYSFGTAFFIRPGSIISSTKQDGWIIPLVAGAFGLVVALLWLALAKANPGLSLVQVSTKVAGKFFGAVISLIFILYFIQTSSWVIRNLGDFMKTALMPNTPISVFHVMFLIVACYAVIKGIETIGRTSEILTPLIIIVIFVIYVSALNDWNWDRLQPVLETNYMKLLRDSVPSMGFPYLETVTIMMLTPYVQKKLGKSLLLGIATSTVLLSGIVFITIGVLGATRGSHLLYPLYTIVKELQIAEFIEHLESTIVIVWLICIFLKLCVAYFCAAEGICQLFKLKDRTWVSIPLILLISGIALSLSDNVVGNVDWDEIYFSILMSLWYCSTAVAAHIDLDREMAAKGKEACFMIIFIVLYAMALAGGMIFLIVNKKSVKEISVFTVLALLAFASWIAIFLKLNISPNQWIGSIIDWMGLSLEQK